jgi:hypothetical protein
MSATSVLLRGRVAAEALMLDTVTIRRRTGESTDGDTGVTTPVWTVVYSWKGKVQQRSTQGSNRDVGEAERLASSLELHLPITATGPQSDDVATVDTSALDPQLVGKTFTVRGPAHKSFATARRLTVEGLTS